jgi:hypothetical protein
MNIDESSKTQTQTTDLFSQFTSSRANSEENRRVRVKRRRSKRRFMKLSLLMPIFLCLLIGGSVFGVVEFQTYSEMYHRDQALAQTGTNHLLRAETLLVGLQKNPFDAQAIQHAKQEFATALPAFVQLNTSLKTLPPVSTSVPIYGGRLRAALYLVPATIQIAQAGIAGCDILNVLISRLRNPLQVQQKSGLTMADFNTISADIHRIKTAFNLAISNVTQVNPVDVQFDLRIARMFATFQKEIPKLQAWFDEVDKLLPVLPTLLGIGTPANYLIEVLDSTELRPGGGFIGNYGIATFAGGRLTNAHITDVDLLDIPYRDAGHNIPFPPAYSWFKVVVHAWSLRDSDLDADFPTAARYGEQNYLTEGGKVPIQGVIAITPALIQHVLKITGPIYVPEYKETVTAQNLIDRIHFHQLVQGGSDRIPSPDGHSSLRKRFTELLAEHLLTRVRQLSPSGFAKFLQLIASSVRSKNIQLYFNSSNAEHLLQRFQLDSAIQAPVGDSLFIVNANIAGDKANNFIINSLDDRVTIDASGNATHRTTISYAWTLPGKAYGPAYRDYMRVYVPPDSNLQTQDGWQPRGTSQAFGREVWAGIFTLNYGQTRTITLTWTERGAAKKDAQGWHYQYLIQKQAGTQWNLHLQVTPPVCAVMDNTSGGLVTTSNQVATLTQLVNEDMSFGISYRC